MSESANSSFSPYQAARLAEQGYTILSRALGAASLHWNYPDLLTAHRMREQDIRLHLSRETAFARALLDFEHKCLARAPLPESFSDPAILSNFMSLLTMISSEYRTALSEPHRTQAIEAVHNLLGRVVSNYVDLVDAQIDGLVELVTRVRSFLREHSRHKRVILLEFPLGNTIPVRIQEHFLRADGRDMILLRTSLTRNTQKSKGVTRQELINGLFDGFEFHADDIVIYTDEWNTGANFKALTEAVSRAIRSYAETRLGVALLPIGLLSINATEDPKYEEHKRHHDKLVSALGTQGERYRIKFKPFVSAMAEPIPFFWAEHDRKAGYRKLDLVGAVFSSIDATIDVLAKDSFARERAYKYFLEAAGIGQPRSLGAFLRRIAHGWLLPIVGRLIRSIPPSLQPMLRHKVVGLMPIEMRAMINLEHTFQAGYLEYQKRRADLDRLLRQMKVDGNALTGVEDARVILTEATALFTKILGDTPAEKCIVLAASFIRHEGSTDPAEQFYFKEHTPISVELDEEPSVLHKILISKMVIRISEKLQD